MMASLAAASAHQRPRRVGFRVASRLRFGQRLGKWELGRLHAAQDVRAGAVQDAAHLDQPIARQTFLKRSQDGDSAGNRGLEAELLAARARQLPSSVP